MATKKEETAAYDGEERVSFMLPVTGIDAQSMKPLYVGVNGESVRIQPGVPVMLKRKFVEALSNSTDQRLAAWRYMQQQQAKSRKALSEM